MAISPPRRATAFVGALATACALVLVGCEWDVTRHQPPADATVAFSGATLDAGTPQSSHADEAVSYASVQEEAHDVPGTLLAAPPGISLLLALDGPANPDGTLGSGCADEQESTLPDGVYYAYVLALESRSMTVDVACVFGRDSDQWRAYQDVDGADGATFTHVVMNDVVVEHELQVGRDATLHRPSSGWAGEPLADAADGAQAIGAGTPIGVWVVVRDGRAMAAIEPHTD